MKQVCALKTPLWLQRFNYITNPVSYWQKAYSSYKDAFYAQGINFGKPLMVFYTPSAAKQIIENCQGELTTTSFDSELTAIFGDSSFFILEGTNHKKMRKLLIPALHGKHIKTYGELICNLVNNLIENLPFNQSFSALEIAQEISMQVMIKLLFGNYQQERYQKIKQLMINMVSLFAANVFGFPLFFKFLQQDLGLVSPWGNFLQQRRKIQQLIYQEIAERRNHPNQERTDILSLLMTAQDEKGNFLNDEELLGQLLSLLFTGNESTAASIAWSWYEVYRNSKIKEKLLEEINNLGDSPEPLSLFNLPYLSAVCNETLRKYPVTMFMIPRIVKNTTEINGYQLDKGMLVTVGTYILHHREDIYDQPEEFKPERFIEHRFSSFEFLPFGRGMRGCIGADIALYQMKLTLATIISHHRLELTNYGQIFPKRRNTILTPIKLRIIRAC